MPTLIEERAGRLKAMRELASKAEAESRDFTDDERSTLEGHMTEVKSLGDRIKDDNKRQQFSADLQQFLGDADVKALNEDTANLKAWAGQKRIKSIGEMFVESPEFLESFKAAAPNGTLPSKSRFQMNSAVEVPGGLKALIAVGADGGTGIANLLDPQRLPTLPAAWQALVLRSIITTGTTTAEQVKYARMLRAGAGSVNNAAGVPEATTDAAVGSGNPAVTPVQAGVKPQSTIAFSIETASVITIAHWAAATRQALSDSGQLKTLIDNFLSTGLDHELERQILSGDSDNGEEFDGILNTSGTLSQAYDATNGILGTIRKAITKVKNLGLAQPNAILLAPEDLEKVDLLRAEGTGNYLGANPFSGAANTSLWRLPIVEVPTLAAGTALVGDFRTCVLWDREQTTITATDSHADFFIRNLVAILAESRAAFGVLEPDHIAVARTAA
jgi:HK97 family phage major capsid protein